MRLWESALDRFCRVIVRMMISCYEAGSNRKTKAARYNEEKERLVVHEVTGV